MRKLILILALAGAAVAAPMSRDWFYWPFSATSPWNMPIGNTSTYTTVTGLTSLPGLVIQSTSFTDSIVRAYSDSPVGALLYSPASGAHTNINFLNGSFGTPPQKVCANTSGNETTLRSFATSTPGFFGNFYSTIIVGGFGLPPLPPTAGAYIPTYLQFGAAPFIPNSACPSPDPGTDSYITIVQPNGFAIEAINAIVLDQPPTNTLLAPIIGYFDTQSDGQGEVNGRRASMLPAMAGIIRQGELTNGVIPHALMAQMAPSILMEANALPAYAWDRNAGYSGTLPMGSLLSIPTTYDCTAHTMSAAGVVLCTAVQNYGIIPADRGGSGMALCAELGITDTLPTGGDLAKILAQLKLVSANTGTPLTTLAPPFSPAWSIVQSVPAIPAVAASFTITIPSPGTHSGDQGLLVFSAQSATAHVNVTPTGGCSGTWTLSGQSTTHNDTEIWRCLSMTSGATSISVSSSASVSSGVAFIEFTGGTFTARIGTQSANSAACTVCTAHSIAATAGDLVLSVITTSGTLSSGVTGGFIPIASGNPNVCIGFGSAPTTATVQTTCTFSSGTMDSLSVTYEPKNSPIGLI